MGGELAGQSDGLFWLYKRSRQRTVGVGPSSVHSSESCFALNPRTYTYQTCLQVPVHSSAVLCSEG